MNEERHWNTIAPSYNDEIFDVFKSDFRKRLPQYFERYGNKAHRAIDFGCGTGKAFSYLAPRFKHVLALDISDECLTIARRTRYSNVTIQQADLTDESLRFPKADFALCCNVAILPEPEQNLRILRTIRRSLKRGGIAMVVIPSLDSALYAAWRLMEWYKRDGEAIQSIDQPSISALAADKLDLVQGIIPIDNHPTKHYMQTELPLVFAQAGFKIETIDKVEYSWKTEFEAPPSWMKDPYPWDWLVVCRA